MKPLRVGTRGSQLARRQTALVIAAIKEYYPEFQVEEVILTTSGDRNTTTPLPEIGGKGLFTQELEQALLEGEIDCAVHSLKDLPTELPSGLLLGGVPRRASPQDAVVIFDEGINSFEDLPEGTVVGTSSNRRAAQLRLHRPDLVVRNIRGNLDTRLRKLATGTVDALLLAAAGLERLGRSEHHFLISTEICLPAPGQGAIAVEVRSEDPVMHEICNTALNDRETRLAVTAERAFLLGLGGGCQVPIGALAILVSDSLRLQGMVAKTDGTRYVRDELCGVVGGGESLAAARAIGARLAVSLIQQGAKEILGCV